MASTQEDLAAAVGLLNQAPLQNFLTNLSLRWFRTFKLKEAFNKLSSSQKVKLNDLGRLITFMNRNVASMNKKQERLNSLLQSGAYDENSHEAVMAAQNRDEFYALAGQDELLTLAGKGCMGQAYVSGDEDKIAKCYCMRTEMDEDEAKITVKTWMNMTLEKVFGVSRCRRKGGSPVGCSCVSS